MEIQIPHWVSINNYRTMTTTKKSLASAGNKLFQYE
jgi:hypothetical protein